MAIWQEVLVGVIAVIAGVFVAAGGYLADSAVAGVAPAFLIGAGGLTMIMWYSMIFMVAERTESPLPEYVGAAGAAVVYAQGGVVNWSQLPAKHAVQNFPDAWLITAVGMVMVGLLKTQPIKGHVDALYDEYLGDDEAGVST